MWVKIEGITSEDDALLAIAMGADALGFVFAPSPRQVTVTVASDIVKRLPNDIMTIGVFGMARLAERISSSPVPTTTSSRRREGFAGDIGPLDKTA